MTLNQKTKTVAYRYHIRCVIEHDQHNHYIYGQLTSQELEAKILAYRQSGGIKEFIQDPRAKVETLEQGRMEGGRFVSEKTLFDRPCIRPITRTR